MDRVMKITQRQCLLALLSSVIVVICVFIGITMNLTTLYDENFDHMGIRTFCMFTVNSNILAALSMLLCIPYTIDGLRTGDYYLPDWVVVLMHISVTAVSLTFLISLCILAPVKGFVLIFTGSRFFLHGVCPVLSILTFCCYIRSHKIRLWESFLPLIPVFLYALVYLIMVVFIGEENGGWNDFYGFATRLPLWIPVVSILPLTYGIAALLRWGHNTCCQKSRERDVEFYRQAYGDTDLVYSVAEMARSRKKELRSDGGIVIPTRLIGYLIQNSSDHMEPQEAYRRYFEVFLEEA
jgi:hypothetical protein